MFCESCGKTMHEAASFCQSCGARSRQNSISTQQEAATSRNQADAQTSDESTEEDEDESEIHERLQAIKAASIVLLVAGASFLGFAFVRMNSIAYQVNFGRSQNPDKVLWLAFAIGVLLFILGLGGLILRAKQGEEE